jgi:uncharacterized protein YjiS (DUF1127 family)
MSLDFATTATFAREQTQSGFLARAIDNWRARRSVETLLRLDDHTLRDMGTTRAEVAWAAHLPLSTNAALALEERVRLGARR